MNQSSPIGTVWLGAWGLHSRASQHRSHECDERRTRSSGRRHICTIGRQSSHRRNKRLWGLNGQSLVACVSFTASPDGVRDPSNAGPILAAPWRHGLAHFSSGSQRRPPAQRKATSRHRPEASACECSEAMG